MASPACSPSFPPSVLKTLLMAASIGMVVPLHAQPKPSPAEPRGPESRRLPKREDLVVPGVYKARAAGGFIALEAQPAGFRLRFLDEDKRLLPRQAPRALVRWNPLGRVGEERSILNLGQDEETLVGNVPVYRPYQFKAYVTLLDADGKAIETLVIDYRS